MQSDVPEVTELTWILSNSTPMGLLERGHSYKDKTAKGISSNHGLFAYPVLMAADILLYGAARVPVGKDQKQHLEMTRDIAIKFNQQYGETFVVPEPDIPDSVAMVPGIDGQKMSKSYGNTIELFAEKNVLKKAIMSIKTDAKPIEEPKDPDQCTLFSIYSLFLDKPQIAELRTRYETPGLKYSDIKKELLETTWTFFEPYREKRQALLEDYDGVKKILAYGADKARSIADEYLTQARKATGLNY